MLLSRRFTRSQFTTLPVVTLLVAALSAQEAFAQDINAMAKWTAATVIHYSVVGEFSGETRIMSFEQMFPVSDSAQVTDRVEVEFDWDQQEFKLVGAPVFRNVPSTTGALRVLEGCPATQIEGAFEFATIVEWKELPYPMSGISLVIRRDYAGGAIPHPARESGAGACGHRWDQISAVSATYESGVGAPPAMALAMPGSIPISADGKSLIETREGWTWTYTPTIVK